MAEQLPYLGNHLAFTNALVQPKRQAFHYVSDSNLDWGQNDDRLETWLVATGRTAVPVDPPNPLPGEIIYHVRLLGGARYNWIRRNLQPLEHFRHSFLLFRLTPEEFSHYLADERRFAADPPAAAVCGGESMHPLADAERIVTEPQEPAGLVCLETRKPVEIVLESERGGGPVGAQDVEGLADRVARSAPTAASSLQRRPCLAANSCPSRTSPRCPRSGQA
jgi:hypothetical protein